MKLAGSIEVHDFAATVRDWVENGQYGEQLRMIELRHVGSPHPVKRFPTTEETNVDELIGQLLARAQRDADAFKGDPQTYEFLAYFGSGSEAGGPSETYRGTFTGTIGTRGNTRSTLEPTYEGSLSLIMRHADAMATHAQSAHESVREENNRLRTENAALREERAQVWDVLMALTDVRVQTERDMRREAAEAARWDEVLGTVKVLLPAAVNRITGQQILPEIASPMVELMRQAFDQMEPKHMEALSAAFSDKPQVMIALTEAFSKFIDDRDKRKATAELVAKTKMLAPAAPAPPVARIGGLNGANKALTQGR